MAMQFETRCVHVGVDKDSAYLSATTPIYPSSTFRWDDLNTNRGFDYTRSGNPTRRALEENLAALEGGIDCRATCTGMAAIAATTIGNLTAFERSGTPLHPVSVAEAGA